MSLVILDRDGVINAESDDYIRSLAEWTPLPGSLEAIAALSRAGHTVVIATNQSGLARGYFSLDDLRAIHRELCRRVEDLGGTVAGIFYCPHHPDDGCDCRKPATGLLRAIESELGLPLASAVLVGDSLKDLQAAAAAGCRPVLVRTGRGAATLGQLQVADQARGIPDTLTVCDDLADAARTILATESACAPKGDR